MDISLVTVTAAVLAFYGFIGLVVFSPAPKCPKCGCKKRVWKNYRMWGPRSWCKGECDIRCADCDKLLKHEFGFDWSPDE